MHRRALKIAAVFAALTFIAGAADAGKPLRQFRAGPLRVMTQNLYVGGDILLPLAVPPEQFPEAAALVIQQIIATNFPERAMVLADEMLAQRPDLGGGAGLSARAGVPGHPGGAGPRARGTGRAAVR